MKKKIYRQSMSSSAVVTCSYNVYLFHESPPNDISVVSHHSFCICIAFAGKCVLASLRPTFETIYERVGHSLSGKLRVLKKKETRPIISRHWQRRHPRCMPQCGPRTKAGVCGTRSPAIHTWWWKTKAAFTQCLFIKNTMMSFYNISLLLLLERQMCSQKILRSSPKNELHVFIF